MPQYRVQLKQGRRTITNHLEAKSVADCLAFFQTMTTMQVSEILEIKYEDNSTPPVDDFGYWAIYKGIVKNDARASRQIILNNVKLSKNEKDIALACRTHLEVLGLNVDSVMTSLFKQSIT